MLHRAEITEYGVHFKTGKPVKVHYLHLAQDTPDMGERFQQHIEPAGRYMIHNYDPERPRRRWEAGTANFKNPLVILFNTEAGGTYDGNSWKFRLYREFEGLTGKSLSEAIAMLGYDAIITVAHDYERRGMMDTREIVDLTMFRRGL